MIPNTRHVTADSTCFFFSGASSALDTRYLTADLTCFFCSGVDHTLDTRYLTTDFTCFFFSGAETLYNKKARVSILKLWISYYYISLILRIIYSSSPIDAVSIMNFTLPLVFSFPLEYNWYASPASRISFSLSIISCRSSSAKSTSF